MLALRKVAVTGSLSSGKSAVCQILKDLGAYVVSADEIVHRLLLADPITIRKVVGTLGPDVLSENQLDRKKIADRVFSRPEQLRVLESILHPAVRDEILKQYQRVKDKPEYCLFVAEIPLLHETEGAPFYDAVITVTAEETIRLKRFLQKGSSSEDFFLRTSRQLPEQAKAIRSHYVIENTKTLEDLKKEVTQLKSLLCRI